MRKALDWLTIVAGVFVVLALFRHWPPAWPLPPYWDGFVGGFIISCLLRRLVDWAEHQRDEVEELRRQHHEQVERIQARRRDRP